MGRPKHQKKHRVTQAGYVPVANPDRAAGAAAIAASNASGTHASRNTRRMRTRTAVRQHLISEQLH